MNPYLGVLPAVRLITPASVFLQRAFVTSKWTIGLVLYGVGWGLGWAGSGSLGLFLLAFMVWALAVWHLVLWAWEGARTDRQDPKLIPVEYLGCAQAAKGWAFVVCLNLVLDLLVFALGKFDLREAMITLAALLRALSWLVYLTPGVPPGERRFVNLPVHQTA